jgi:hypothetical protein
VSEPKDGTDIAVYRLLAANPDLAWTFLLPITTRFDRPDTRLLERIVRDYPKSSYTDYARFALARAYVGGTFDASTAPDTAKEAAIALLQKIDYKTFAHGPSALILWLKIAPEKDRDRIRKQLDTEFADSFEWLAEQAESMTPDDWEKLKKEAPVIRGPRKQRP